MFRKFSFISLIFIASITASAAHLEDNINKINENFYVGKIANQSLYLVMERYTNANSKSWKHYIRIQSFPMVIEYAANLLGKDKKPLAPNFNADGALHFKRVLEETNLDLNEVWIAYVTTNANPKPIPDNLELYYSSDYRGPTYNDFAKDIAMYVTVTSSPKALVTSHMGISRTAEGIKNKIAGTSLDLHSFAAKVMLKHNPERKFMINAPNLAMRDIILKSLPKKSVSLGTLDFQKEINEKFFASKADYINQEPRLFNRFDRRAKEAIDDLADRFKEFMTDYENGKKTEDNLAQEKSIIHKKAKKKGLIFDEKTGSLQISEELTRTLKDELVNEGYLYWKNNSDYYPRPLPNIETFKQLLDEYPPIISLELNEKRHLESITILDAARTQQWLEMTKGNTDYQWLFTYPFLPAPSTHYIAVDLEVLAKSKQLDTQITARNF